MLVASYGLFFPEEDIMWRLAGTRSRSGVQVHDHLMQITRPIDMIGFFQFPFVSRFYHVRLWVVDWSGLVKHIMCLEEILKNSLVNWDPLSEIILYGVSKR